MSGTPEVVVHREVSSLVAAVADRLISTLVEAQSARGHAHVVLTGGGTGIKTLAALADAPARDSIDFGALDVWWGDDRFVPAKDGDRNALQAQEALLGRVAIPAERVHPMAPSDGVDGEDIDAAAARYAAELARYARPEDHAQVPSFDVLLLGVGPDGHVASLFPESAGVHVQDAWVIPVRNSPKPPPNRISLTFPAIQAAREVWLVAAGADKAPAVQLALSGAGPLAVPAAGAIGRRRTVWLLDAAAASALPAGLNRIASP